MFVLFCLALAALVALSFSELSAASAVLFVGYCGLLVGDPIAAQRAEAPIFFARLRPWQMSIAVVSLSSLLFLAWRSGL